MASENEAPRAAGTDTGPAARERHSSAAASAEEIKARVSLADLLLADGHEPRRSGNRWLCRCPFHEERTPSFFVFGDGGFHCFGCGAKGDAFDYVQRRDGVSFGEAKAWLAARAGLPGDARARAPLPARPKAEAATHELSADELRQVRAMAERLAGDARLCERIAASRGWKPETIRSLALEPSLGWHGDKLAFIYECGVKLRWKEMSGERRFRFAFGNAQRLWRDWLLMPLPAMAKVFITEGETDAITLLDAGMEKDGGALVVALPGASILPAAYAARLAGREIVLCFDADKAGEAATARAAALLHAHARSVSVLDWKGVRDAA